MQSKDISPQRETTSLQILERHRHEMMRVREDITTKYREAKVGMVALQDRSSGKHTHHSVGESRMLFSNAATRYLHEQAGDSPTVRMYASILAIIPSMIKGHRALRNRNISRSQRHDAKLEMIEFNDTMRTIIETNPHIDEETLLELVTSAMLSYGYSAQDINESAQETKMALVGMKHELAFEAVLYWLPEGYEILETTDEDDKHGADFKVRSPNGVILYIDVKSSIEAAQRATEDNAEFYARFHEETPANQLVLHSGFKNEDFNGWHPKNESVQRELPNLDARLRHASIETERQRKLASTGRIKIGHH